MPCHVDLFLRRRNLERLRPIHLHLSIHPEFQTFQGEEINFNIEPVSQPSTCDAFPASQGLRRRASAANAVIGPLS